MAKKRSKANQFRMAPEQIAQVAKSIVMQTQGNYPSTKGGNRNMAGWTYPNGSADSDQSKDNKTIRAQSRDLVRSSAIASGAISTAVSNTVGIGLKPMSRIMKSMIPNMTKEMAKEWQRKAEDYFWIIADSTDLDWTGSQNFWQMEATAFRSFLESGDCFAIRRYDPDSQRPFGLSIQLIESDRVSNPNDAEDTQRIISGIEKDERGRASRYWVCNRNPFDTSDYSKKEWTPVPAKDVLHLFRRNRPDQSRGVAFLAPAIEPLKQLSRYAEAELTAAVVTAMFAIFVKTDAQSNPIFPGEIPGAVDTENGVSISGGLPVTPAGTSAVKLQSGAMVNLAPGESIEAVDPKRPNQAFDPFFQAMVRQIGMALQIPFEILLKHYTSSYTAARAAMLDAWVVWQEFRSLMSSSFCGPIWTWFIEEAVARGYLYAPGFWTSPVIKRAYCFAQWTGPAMGSLNPAVEAQANYMNFLMGAKTMGQISMDSFGNDFDEVMDAQEDERARLVSLPVPANGMNVSTPIIDPTKEQV